MVQNMKRTVGRPRSFDKGAALGMVAQTFRANGFSATSLDEISHATGLQRPSLYSAFGDKKSMYMASLAALHADIESKADALDNANLELREILVRLFNDSIVGYLSGDTGPQGCLAIGTATTEASNDVDIQRSLQRFMDIMDSRIAKWFERAGCTNSLNHARIISAALHSISVRARAGQPIEVLDAIASTTIDLVLSAVNVEKSNHKG